MDFFELVRRRRSVRAFQRTMVETEKLASVLEAANAAPSAGNLQAYEIYVATKPEHRKALAQAALRQDFLGSAPVVLVFCAHPERSSQKYGDRGTSLYALQDATVACTFAMLAATALDLATVWIGAFHDEAVRKVIGAPKGHVPVAMLPIGYPAETPAPATRRGLNDLVHEL